MLCSLAHDKYLLNEWMNKWKERRKEDGRKEGWARGRKNKLALDLLSWELGCKHDYGRENVEILP